MQSFPRRRESTSLEFMFPTTSKMDSRLRGNDCAWSVQMTPAPPAVNPVRGGPAARSRRVLKRIKTQITPRRNYGPERNTVVGICTFEARRAVLIKPSATPGPDRSRSSCLKKDRCHAGPRKILKKMPHLPVIHCFPEAYKIEFVPLESFEIWAVFCT